MKDLITHTILSLVEYEKHRLMQMRDLSILSIMRVVSVGYTRVNRSPTLRKSKDIEELI